MKKIPEPIWLTSPDAITEFVFQGHEFRLEMFDLRLNRPRCNIISRMAVPNGPVDLYKELGADESRRFTRAWIIWAADWRDLEYQETPEMPHRAIYRACDLLLRKWTRDLEDRRRAQETNSGPPYPSVLQQVRDLRGLVAPAMVRS